MPDYQLNELPTNFAGVTNVNLFLVGVRILEIEEKKNKITIQLSQYIDWTDQRIRASFRNNDLIKLSPKAYLQIWQPDLDMFTTDLEEWKSLYESKSGERGMFNRGAAKEQAAKNGRRDPDYEFGTNPCSEIILRSKEFCNLTEIVIREDDTVETLKQKVKLATILGTWQSTLTNFKYLNRNCISRFITMSTLDC